MQVDQKPTFRRIYKKLPARQRDAVNNAIRVIIADPERGEPKVGDLAGVRVYKFKIAGHLTLLAYNYTDNKHENKQDEIDDVLTLLALGGHENFYRDLKRGK